ncbi:MAG: DNA-binding protein [Spirochaetes bacterium]|nr:DNA-binding protein [Spirochaetota bacterium]
MRFSEGTQGRVFVLSLDDGETVPEVIEGFAREKGVVSGYCILIGGAKRGSRMVVGDKDDGIKPSASLFFELDGMHEILGIGTLFPDEEDAPVLHMHVSAGRAGKSRTGCSRPGIKVWEISEVILVELERAGGMRVKNHATGISRLTF